MKRHRIHIIRSSFKIMVWCVVLLSGACTDEEWDNGEGRPDGNAVSFNVTSGITSEPATRARTDAAEDTTELLKPLVLKSPGLERPLYLHTYVAQESERATGVPAETRAAQVDDINDFFTVNGNGGFGVTARYTDNREEFMSAYATAKPLAGQTGKDIWSTAPVYYWPNNDRVLRFSAFAPMSAKGLLKNLAIGDNQIDFDYTVPVSESEDKDAEQQPDIMFAVKECNKATSTDNKVPLNFRHALSAVKFAVRDVVGGTIGKITISGVAGTGHCTYTGQSDSDADVFTWSQLGEAECSYSQVFDYRTTDNYIPNPSDYDESKDVVLNATMPEKTFLLIPQDIPADATIMIEFTRDTDKQLFTLTGKILDNKVTKWEPGKEYVYTISTSSSNWTYYFEVTGCNQSINDDDPKKGVFKDVAGQIIVNQTVTEGAYYKVKSYRVRANNRKEKELVPWKAVTTDGTTTFPEELKEYSGQYKDMVIKPDVWIPEKTTNGAGSFDLTQYVVTFRPQMVGTSWKGDWDMRAKAVKGTSANPFDLSTTLGRMNTANCYVVNAPGYYKFPLVYGNAIENGTLNTQSYTYSGGDYKATVYGRICEYPSLKRFTDYNGQPINEAKINGGTNAVLVWQDAYNLISDVKLNFGDGEYNTVLFKVNSENLQQGNAVLAIRNARGDILWSWHIWITEHWVKGNNLNLGTGDVACDAYDANRPGFTVAPYNLGWCDPKDVWYMKRTGQMTFTQEMSGKQVALDIEQREKKIEYWIGNNVYYQFGRKDPIVGFMNTNSVVKYNFGEYPYRLEAQPKDIKDGIRNPNVLYVGANEIVANNDWLQKSYYNLWNNSTQPRPTKLPESEITNYAYSGVKTVYDPSPVGYQIPPVGFFRLITNGNFKAQGALVNNVLDFNGTEQGMTGHAGYYIYNVYSQKNKQGATFQLTGTGHRWYGNSSFEVGYNFNPATVYLWSNQIHFVNVDKCGYGLALGGKDDTSDFRFCGRRAMARPIRPVKSFTR